MTRILPLLLLLGCVCDAARAEQIETLPGSEPLTSQGDLSQENLEAVDRYLLKLVERSLQTRQQHWSRDYSSAAAYQKSVEPNRQSLRRRIGAVDERLPVRDLQLVASLERGALLANNDHVRVLAVRWSVFEGVEAEGLLLEPAGRPLALVVALPDADVTPERLAGLDGDAPARAAYARRLAEAGCRVLVPTLIDRRTTWSGNPRIRMMNQTHREFIYRQAFFMGRHLIGYEVQKVLAAVDYFESESVRQKRELPIGVVGYGEGGLIAIYSAAIDTRIDAALVSGYFQPRELIHREPVYRNVYGLLNEFGDAQIASLIAPRSLVVEACASPEAANPPPLVGRRNYAAYGALNTPSVADVQGELARARQHYRHLGAAQRATLVVSGEGAGPPASDEAVSRFLDALGIAGEPARRSAAPLRVQNSPVDPERRMKRQFDQLVGHTQRIVRQSPFRRSEFWKDADSSSLQSWQQTTRPYRDLLWDEVIGRLPKATLPPRPRTRLIYDTPKWKGYEVLLDVYDDVSTYGILLVPNDLKPGQRRPVVVAQHGRNGRPQDVCTPHEDTRAYHSFGAKLADRGFVVYAPQNLYLGEEHYRTAQRKAFALGMTIFAPMVRQHEQAVSWLASLPFVDPQRIGFYGLSYGGKSAMLIPAVLQQYCLSICSGDFNEEVWKHTSVQDRYSFMFTLEHEHTEFDFGERFNYAEIAGLIAPRPFMVERGHRDGVAPDEWVAYEYAKVRRLYATLGIGDRTEIEFFDGVHEIHSQGTFDFLHKHLNWPKP